MTHLTRDSEVGNYVSGVRTGLPRVLERGCRTTLCVCVASSVRGVTDGHLVYHVFTSEEFFVRPTSVGSRVKTFFFF